MISPAVSFATRQPPYYIKAIAMAIPALMLGFQISGWVFFLPGAMQGHADFRQIYTAAYMLRTGHRFELYDSRAQKHFQDTVVSPEAVVLPFIRPAYSAMLFVPFSFFSYRVAYFLFLAVNICLLMACYRLLKPQWSKFGVVWNQLGIALLVSFLPIGAALMQGQDSVLFLLLLILALASMQRGSDLVAGLFVGAGIFKLQLALPIAILYFLWKKWRFVTGFSLTASLAGLVSIWATGLRETSFYVHSLAAMGTAIGKETSPLYYPLPLELMGNIHALVYASVSGHVSMFIVTIMSLCISAAIALWVAIRGRNLPCAIQFALAIATAAAVSFYSFIHDLSVLLVPLALGLNAMLRAWEVGQTDKLLGVASAAIFVAPALLVWATPYFYLVALAEVAFVVAALQSSRQPCIPIQPDRITQRIG